MLEQVPPEVDEPSILVFDSGSGGLSIVKAVRDYLPNIQIDYLADHRHFPYGRKNQAQITDRVISVIGSILGQLKPTIVIIACNTASTSCLDALRKKFDCLFVGVVPAIKLAAEQSKTLSIGVLATPTTIDGEYTQELITQYANHCLVTLHGSETLADIAEAKIQGLPISEQDLQDEINALKSNPLASNMDIIVLACTHFPLLKKELEQVSGDLVTFIDSGEAIARRAHYLLTELGFSLSRELDPSLCLKSKYFTSQNKSYSSTQLDKLSEYFGAKIYIHVLAQ